MDVAALAISAVSLVFAGISFFMSINAQRLQNRVNELEVILKESELEKIEQAKKEKNSSCVEARMVRVAKGKYKLKVWNSGNTRVTNVTASTPDECGIILYNDKMPYEFLEPQKGFEIVAIFHNGSSSKFLITTEWTDLDGNQQKKEQMGDI